MIASARRPLVTSGLLFATLAAVAAGLPAQDQGAPPKPVIGVVDFVEAIQKSPRYQEGKKQLEERNGQIEEQLKKAEADLKEMKARRDGLKEGSLRRMQADLEMELALKDFQGRRQLLFEELRRQNDELVVTCYEDVEKAIAKLARQRGLQLVLRLHREMRSGSVEDRSRVYESRVVWYSADEVNLTAEVIKLLLATPVEAPGKQEPTREPAPTKDGQPPTADKK